MNRATIDDLLSRHRRYHNGLQVDRFIVGGAGITPFGMYRQALREMHGRWTGLRLEVLRMRRLDIEIRELQAKQLASKFEADDYEIRFVEFQREKRALDIHEKKMTLQEAQLAHADAIEEFSRFALIAEQLHAQFGDLTENQRELLELEFHKTSIMRDVAMEIAVHGNTSTNTLRIVSLLPQEQRAEVVEAMSDRTTCAKWIAEFEYKIPQIASIPAALIDEVKLLVLEGAGFPQLGYDDKTAETCRQKFDNGRLFGFEPHHLHE